MLCQVPVLAHTAVCAGTMRSQFNAYTFCMAGGAPMTTTDACTHPCGVAASTLQAGDPVLTFGQTPTAVFLKAGEAEGVQDGHKDRSMISTSARATVDYANGLGGFCQQTSGRRPASSRMRGVEC
jgi:hypothetical protein